VVTRLQPLERTHAAPYVMRVDFALGGRTGNRFSVQNDHVNFQTAKPEYMGVAARIQGRNVLLSER
jgi:hypothetical protein